jgi:hypothetical protein
VELYFLNTPSVGLYQCALEAINKEANRLIIGKASCSALPQRRTATGADRRVSNVADASCGKLGFCFKF